MIEPWPFLPASNLGAGVKTRVSFLLLRAPQRIAASCSPARAARFVKVCVPFLFASSDPKHGARQWEITARRFTESFSA